MAEPLKNNFNSSLIKKFASELKAAHNPFDQSAFIKSVLDDQWEQRELKNRMMHTSQCINKHLKLEYSDALAVLLKVAPNFGGFEAMVFPDFVEQFGLEHEDLSLDALEELTKYSSSEFAIRPFIIQNSKKVMERMLEWSKSENHHVRRFSSEGCRSRLPWAMALSEFKKDPSHILPILNNLKNDDSLYVRKSVANNINDISKDNPEVVLELTSKWYGKTKNTDWIVKQGLRTLSKKGNEKALEILGFNDNICAKVSQLELSSDKVKIGEDISFQFSISHEEKNNGFLKIGFMVSYVKSNNKTSDKIFHITEKEFEPKKEHIFKKKLSMKDLSTRKHYPGKHTIHVLINGKPITNEDFMLFPS